MYPLPSSTLLPSPPLLPSLLPSSPLLPSFPPPLLPSSSPLFFQEQSRNSRLQLEVEGGVVSQQALTELQEMVADLRAEKELLKQTNERLVKR